MLFLLLQQWFSTFRLMEPNPDLRIFRDAHKIFYHKTIDTFCFIVLTMSVTSNFRGVTERHSLLKEILPQQRIRHTNSYRV